MILKIMQLVILQKNTNNNTNKSSDCTLFNPSIMIITVLSFLMIMAITF